MLVILRLCIQQNCVLVYIIIFACIIKMQYEVFDEPGYCLQGATIILANLGSKSSIRNRIRAVAAMAPAAYLGNLPYPLRLLQPLCSSIRFVRLLSCGHLGELLPSNWLTRFLAVNLCRDRDDKGLSFICSYIFSLFTGFDKANINIVSRVTKFALTARICYKRFVLFVVDPISCLSGTYSCWQFSPKYCPLLSGRNY